ncbi:MAG: DUF333 domain-containing protein [bacterium]
MKRVTRCDKIYFPLVLFIVLQLFLITPVAARQSDVSVGVSVGVLVIMPRDGQGTEKKPPEPEQSSYEIGAGEKLPEPLPYDTNDTLSEAPTETLVKPRVPLPFIAPASLTAAAYGANVTSAINATDDTYAAYNTYGSYNTYDTYGNYSAFSWSGYPFRSANLFGSSYPSTSSDPLRLSYSFDNSDRSGYSYLLNRSSRFGSSNYLNDYNTFDWLGYSFGGYGIPGRSGYAFTNRYPLSYPQIFYPGRIILPWFGDQPGNTEMPNPAAVYCKDNGGTYEIRTDEKGGQYGMCIFDNGCECDAWAYYRGECQPSCSEHLDFMDRKWKLQSFGVTGEENLLIAGTEITLQFGGDNTCKGSAGCNSYFGTYEASASGIISTSHIGCTEMACLSPSGVMEQERQYLEALMSVCFFETDHNTLKLFYDSKRKVLNFVTDQTTPSTGIDLESFKELAGNADCADLENRLFLIDKDLILWWRRGTCFDNAYSAILYKETVDTIACMYHDSIGGPQNYCYDPNYADMFETIINNLDCPDLGLDATHTVKEIPLPPRPEEPEPRLRNFSNSGCKGKTRDGSFPGERPEFSYQYHEEEGVLFLQHNDAYYNCCIEEITLTMSVKGMVINIYEEEKLEGSGCRCMCNYDLTAEVVNLSSGVYTVNFFNQESGTLLGSISQVIIP